MVPHVLGWFPISAAWVMMIHQLDLASDDLAAVSDVRIPDWVLGAIWGTIIIVKNPHDSQTTLLVDAVC